ncbi:MAG TPA: hypothetical protein VH817_09280 [Thermoleophilaceae bacterium]
MSGKQSPSIGAAVVSSQPQISVTGPVCHALQLASVGWAGGEQA